MSIVRTHHNKENPYVMLNKSVLEDPSISWAAKGLWSYLMSRPDNWNVSVAHLSKIYHGKGGKEKAIYSLLNELCKNGYCTRNQTNLQNGHFSTFEYVITEFKSKEAPQSGFQPVASQRDAVEGYTNKEGKIKEIKNNDDIYSHHHHFSEEKMKALEGIDIETPGFLSKTLKQLINDCTVEEILQARAAWKKDTLIEAAWLTAALRGKYKASLSSKDKKKNDDDFKAKVENHATQLTCLQNDFQFDFKIKKDVANLFIKDKTCVIDLNLSHSEFKEIALKYLRSI